MAENSSETPKVEAAPKVDVQTDKVGDILRKERITRRIALETIARDLKLNVKYIKALEENRHESLPAPPYIRVYLRSIAKYLQLNPEDIIKKFYEEIGVPTDAAQKTGAGTEKIDVSMSDKRTQGNRSYVVPVAIIIGLIIFVVIAQKLGLISTAENSAQTTGMSIDSSALATQSGDTVVPIDDLQGDDAAAFAEFDSPSPDSFSLTVKATKDSVWIQSFTDGVSWKTYLRTGRVKKFVAHDSINIHIGNNDITEYLLNGKPLKIKSSGPTIFRVDRKGHTIWTIEHWKEVFKGKV